MATDSYYPELLAMPIQFKSPDDRRAYWRARYWKNREAVLAKRRAVYAATPPEIRSAKNRESYIWNRTNLLARQAERRAADPEKRRAAERRNYRLRHYGTENPLPGQLSLDGTKHFMNPPVVCFPKLPPKPRPVRATTSKPKRDPNRRSPVERVALPGRVLDRRGLVSPGEKASIVAGLPPAPKKDPWIPIPVSRWEPGLERVAS